MDKMDNKQEQLDNVSTEMEILRKNQRKMLRPKMLSQKEIITLMA